MITTAEIITGVIRRETGGLPWSLARAQLHAADKGGWTRGGITALNAGLFLGLGRPAAPDELNAMTPDQAFAFYEQRYCRPYLGVPEPLRTLLTDWAVTSWHDDPTKALQTALVRRGVYAGHIDGVLGPKTRAAIVADSNARQTYRDVYAARMRYMVHVAFDDVQVKEFLKAHPTSQLHFLRGWINRTLEFTP